jgi:hypothetical protein
VRVLVVVGLVLLMLGGFSMPAQAETEAQTIDRLFLEPHNSEITGEMVMSLAEWYEIEPLWTLTVLGLETSLGDPVKGGRLVGVHNYGCMKAGRTDTKWGSLSNGTITVGGKRWFTFKDAWTGMIAWGRLIKRGPTSLPGAYLRQLRTGDWDRFCSLYYGNVAGVAEYTARCWEMHRRFRERARAAGLDW